MRGRAKSPRGTRGAGPVYADAVAGPSRVAADRAGCPPTATLSTAPVPWPAPGALRRHARDMDEPMRTTRRSPARTVVAALARGLPVALRVVAAPALLAA